KTIIINDIEFGKCQLFLHAIHYSPSSPQPYLNLKNLLENQVIAIIQLLDGSWISSEVLEKKHAELRQKMDKRKAVSLQSESEERNNKRKTLDSLLM
ncbi:MAG: hypothetical protein O7C59_08310, partial [Rickettsia endosymbiont of Ixodes persulcatus]|nr:hypothetical protein [Rickettsia endosymbiont of Ixodes persulcatus]